MNRIVHFEFPTDNAERTSAFFSEVFGWRFDSWPGGPPYWLVTTGTEGPGINGGMLPRTPFGTVCTIDVAKIDETIAAIEAHGGKIVVPKMPIPGVGWLAYFTDTEGTAFGIMEADKTAS